MKDKIFENFNPVKYRKAVISAKPKLFDRVKKELPEIQKGVLLKNFTTLKIGGPARYFFDAKTNNDLVTALKTAKKSKLPIFVLGGGSNLLVSDKGFNGLVVKVNNSSIEIKKNRIFIGAGVNLTKLAYISADNGLSGFEWAAGIPGTIGGAIYGNAHAFGTKISDLIESIKAIDLKTLKLKDFTNGQCRFSLKNSIFKKNKNLVILSAVINLKEQDKEEVKSHIRKFLEYRMTNHPMNFPSAGSTFINPVVRIKNKKLLEKFTELKEYNKKGAIPAGYLIEKCGLAGKKIGKAQISEKHCNFIINLGGAESKNVLSLMDLAKREVKKKFGIELKPEIQLVGFNKK